MDFSKNIKQWVSIDTEIKKLNDLLKSKREKKHDMLKNIIEYKNDNNLANTLIRISDGSLRFTSTKQFQPITYLYIKERLAEIIDDDEQVEFIINHLKEKRNYKVVEDIKRIYL